MIKPKIEASRALRAFCAFSAVAVWCLTLVNAAEKSEVIFEKLNDSDPTVRSAEARRLGDEKVKESVPALIEALKDKVTGVRINAVVSLGKLKDESAVEPLTDILNNDRVPAARMKAAEALSNFDKEGIKAELLKASDSEDENVRSAAVLSLKDTGGENEVDKLMEKAQKDESWLVRKAAVSTLAGIVEKRREGKGKRKEIEKVIKKAGKDGNKEVREAAEKALKKLEKVPKKKKKWLFF
ncbi:MAG: HEAT repeat domain-containing protein [bacterium]